MRERLVIIGSGMVGMRLVEEIHQRAPGRHAVTVIGDEPALPYDRIRLSQHLPGEVSEEQLVTHSADWCRQRGVVLRTGRKATAIDRERRLVSLADGSQLPYDRLVLATGSTPIVLPVPGKDYAGVVTFRTLADVASMRRAVRPGARAVVIGGGLLGLEAAAGLAKLGMQVTVVHLMGHLMERQLDPQAGAMLQTALEARGLRFALGAKTQALLGDPATGRVRAVRLEDGRELEAELVVMAVGIRPECSLARAAGLATGRGVLVDDHLATSDPRIDGVGECVEHRGQVFGLVAPLYEMAKVLAARLTSCAGETVAPFAGSDPLTKLKVSGIDLVSAGLHTGGEGAEDLVLADYGTGLYRKVVLRDGKLDGMVLLGDTSLAPWYFELMKKRSPVRAERANLLFGPSGGRDEAVPAVAMMGDDAEICGCNGVAKGAICAKIKGLGLASLDEVRAHTKASASCGSCTPLVQQLIALTAGEAAATAPVRQGMCPCTEHGHDAVRAAIARDQLTSIAEVMRALDWKTQDGCHRCRPALNYYLTCARPGDYRDDPQSRFVNERLHANIQKDGTYSVVPRMWGGLTSPRELRAIADVAERYEIPTVKVTGGQRIDLLGVKREDLTKVWSDLNAAGMVSGHAYGKAVRTVKTCVGSEWCRFGVQDSTGLGVALERMTWGAWAPHKVKLGVSGCPRNCAEATIKDFGVVCVESGYELHVGGNGGTKVRVTDLLTKVRTADEALEYCAAFLQLYREEARYLERTAHWIERVGLAGLKARLVEDDAERQALAQRFHEAQRYAQHDPWAEAVQAEATRM